jgi:hypothetical protein
MNRIEKMKWTKIVSNEIYESVEMGFYQKEDLENINFDDIRNWIKFPNQEDICEINEIIQNVCIVIYQIKFECEYPI